MSEPKLESELTDEEKLQMAEDEHIWLNAFACVAPSDEFLRDVGRTIVDKLNCSQVSGDMLGVKIGKVLYVKVHKS